MRAKDFISDINQYGNNYPNGDELSKETVGELKKFGGRLQRKIFHSSGIEALPDVGLLAFAINQMNAGKISFTKDAAAEIGFFIRDSFFKDNPGRRHCLNCLYSCDNANEDIECRYNPPSKDGFPVIGISKRLKDDLCGGTSRFEAGMVYYWCSKFVPSTRQALCDFFPEGTMKW